MVKIRFPRSSRGFVIVGLFGNEFAMEQAIQRLASVEKIEYQVTSRRHLKIQGKSGDQGIIERVKSIVRRSHGYVEQETIL